jgi:hypothetical protein
MDRTQGGEHRFTLPPPDRGCGRRRIDHVGEETSPTLNRSGRSAMNFLADSLATMIRLDETAAAVMERETSIATMIVARSRGILAREAGRAAPKDANRVAMIGLAVSRDE